MIIIDEVYSVGGIGNSIIASANAFISNNNKHLRIIHLYVLIEFKIITVLLKNIYIHTILKYHPIYYNFIQLIQYIYICI